MIVFPSVKLLDELVCHQVKNLFFLEETERKVIMKLLPKVLGRVENCFSWSKNKYYKQGDEVLFSIYHSGQYCIFLYFLSREVFLAGVQGGRVLADKIYYLNKSLNGLDIYYEVEMPEVFHLDHPVGSVMGRAIYGAGFTFAQMCTVGNNRGVYPRIGDNVRMLSGSKILGRCVIGDNVVISANSYVKDTDVPSGVVVFGSSPNIIFKQWRGW